jgi:ABC-2 type transport system permease protein
VNAARAAQVVPALLRAGLLEATASRGPLVVGLLASTPPLIMLAVFSAVARDGPIGRFGEHQVAAYFLSTFIVRQLTGSWASWKINREVRDGTLAARLLRPVHPLLTYGAEGAATILLRALLVLPVVVVLLAGREPLTHDPVLWIAWVASVVGAWLITLCANLTIGALAFFIERSTKVIDIWLAGYLAFSGFLVPIELFPERLRAVLQWLPFRYQIGLCVELMTGAHGRNEAFSLLARQWAFVALGLALATWVWQRGVVRFAAYGG